MSSALPATQTEGPALYYCARCKESFTQTGDYHKRVAHQTSTIFTGRSNIQITVKRNDAGSFVCPTCMTKRFKDPVKLKVSAVKTLCLMFVDVDNRLTT